VGQHHLIASTSHGRTFSLPLSPEANSHRQLGTKQVFNYPSSVDEALANSPQLPPEADVRYATQLTEIPALSGVNIVQVAASDRSSFTRTNEGRVLGFGANDFGQIGLGSTTTVSTVPTPVEIVLAKGYPAGTTITCSNIAAGSQTTFFTVERKELNSTTPLVDILSCGNGQYGTLGTGMWSSAAYAPARVKALSGLQECEFNHVIMSRTTLTSDSEKDKAMVPLVTQSLSIAPSPSAHVFATLDTLRSADAKGIKDGLFGKDVLAWGANGDYQLGNGKRSATASPTHLPSLIPHAIDTLVASSPESAESPIPLTRLQLHATRADAYDPLGKLITRGVRCEETVVAGWNCSVLYNKIVDK
jgi:alpha-tubulin suppressor-like RCC1 family protein